MSVRHFHILAGTARCVLAGGKCSDPQNHPAMVSRWWRTLKSARRVRPELRPILSGRNSATARRRAGHVAEGFLELGLTHDASGLEKWTKQRAGGPGSRFPVSTPAPQPLAQEVEVHRLDQIFVEAGGLRFGAVFRAAVAAHRHEEGTGLRSSGETIRVSRKAM